jgi:hypothetical protein
MTNKQLKQIVSVSDAETVRTVKEIVRQIKFLEKSSNNFSEQQIRVLMGDTTALEERQDYEDSFDKEELNEEGEKYDSFYADDLYDACREAENWLMGEKNDDLV